MPKGLRSRHPLYLWTDTYRKPISQHPGLGPHVEKMPSKQGRKTNCDITNRHHCTESARFMFR